MMNMVITAGMTSMIIMTISYLPPCFQSQPSLSGLKKVCMRSFPSSSGILKGSVLIESNKETRSSRGKFSPSLIPLKKIESLKGMVHMIAM